MSSARKAVSRCLSHNMLLLLLTFARSLAAPAVIAAGEQDAFAYVNPTPMEKLLAEDKTFWYDVGGEYLEKFLAYEKAVKKSVAKNVVILIGDGMGVSTVTATRIYKGQREHGKSGEDHRLVYDDFPNLALVKTYNVDRQVPDSAGTATAYFTGVKTRYGSIGVDVRCDRTIANETTCRKSELDGVMTWAQRAGKDTGIVTTTRLTHSTPSATYAHAPNKDWECDGTIPSQFKSFVKDIGRQLIENAPGANFKVMLGGGLQTLDQPIGGSDPRVCARNDSLNLTAAWIEKHKGHKSIFVRNNEQLEKTGNNADRLLGVFSNSHMPFELLRDKGPLGTPSLSQMTKKALNILKRGPKGFVLMVEGGSIDLAHHDNYARLALAESSEFEKTVSLVVGETGNDTLIIVAADHSHTMTFNGQSKRGNDILGYGIESIDDKPALTLTYANGPGFAYHYSPNASSVLGPWRDPRNDSNRLVDKKYQHMATYERKTETHGGEDVAVFATGPGSHLIRGVVEQNYVAHVISYAACIGPRAEKNSHCGIQVTSSQVKANSNWLVILVMAIVLKCLYS